MTNEEISQIHKAALALCAVIDKYSKGRSLILWGAIDEEEDNSETGICPGENIDIHDLEHLIFNMLGTANEAVSNLEE